MRLDPWYRVVTLRVEVREGRSFSPDEFAIALEQVVFSSKDAPADDTDPEQFFSRTWRPAAWTLRPTCRADSPKTGMFGSSSCWAGLMASKASPVSLPMYGVTP